MKTHILIWNITTEHTRENKKFKKILVKKNVKKVTFLITSKNIKNKKTLYVKVRAYAKIDGKMVYSKWSKAKKVKIK